MTCLLLWSLTALVFLALTALAFARLSSTFYRIGYRDARRRKRKPQEESQS